MDGEDAAVGAEVVVLAGGTGSRYAAQRPGEDKLAAALAGTTVLGRLLADVAPRWPTVVVARPGARLGPLPAGVARRDEELPTAGPLPALAVGLRAARAEVVVLLAGDQPFAGDAVPALLAALEGQRVDGERVDAAVAVDPAGRRQPLLSAVRRAPALAVLDGVEGGLRGRPVRVLLAGLRGVEVPVAARAAHDVDVPADLERARALARAGRTAPS